MPSSIPYDPSLVLANVVSLPAIQQVTAIAAAQAPVNAAQDNLNALLASRRSLDMTASELQNLGIDTGSISGAVNDLNKDIAQVANDYIKMKITAEKDIASIKSNIPGVHATVETPVDYVKTQIKSMPLASDSLNMDVQYFSYDSNKQDSKTFASNISSFITRTQTVLGNSSAMSMGANAQKQVNQQVEKHSVTGVLVVSVSCTHKNAHVLAPLILNPDKAIHSYNALYPGDALDPTNQQEILALAAKDGDSSSPKMTIISGMTYGSSFVAMVHVLKVADTQSSESLDSTMSHLQSQMDAGAWFAKASGGYGVDGQFSNDVKSLLSTQNIQSHVTLISMGIIPSMVANEVQVGVKQFANFDGKSSMDQIATIEGATAADQTSAQASAQQARTGQQMLEMKASTIKSSLDALGKLDEKNNKMLDINSMMAALDDYLKKAQELTTGVPINYYLKEISKKSLAEGWVAKYYPNTGNIRLTNDDSGSGPVAGGSDSRSGGGNSGGGGESSGGGELGGGGESSGGGESNGGGESSGGGGSGGGDF